MAALPRHDPLSALDQVIQRFELATVELHGDDDGYDLHPLPMPEFLRGMAECGEPGTFLDLGCGAGAKLLVAHYLGWEVTGVERHADYLAAASRILPEAALIHGDVRAVTDLTRWDVVYSYRLMVDLVAQHDLNRLIVSRMRPGALFFCPASEPVGLDEVGPSVWRVG